MPFSSTSHRSACFWLPRDFFEELINLSKTERERSEDVNDGEDNYSGEFFVLKSSICID